MGRTADNPVIRGEAKVSTDIAIVQEAGDEGYGNVSYKCRNGTLGYKRDEEKRRIRQLHKLLNPNTRAT